MLWIKTALHAATLSIGMATLGSSAYALEYNDDWLDSYDGAYDDRYDGNDWFYDYYEYDDGYAGDYYDYYDYYDYDRDLFDWEEDGLFQ